MNVGLLGGSFNPPHVGHLLAAVYARATLPLDEVWLMPSHTHPFGKVLAPFEHRRAMCEAMAAAIGPWLKVTDVESRLKGEGRTVDTLSHLTSELADARFWLLLGSDIAKDLPSWKDFGRVESLATVVILNRAGHLSERAVGPPLVAVSSTEVRAALEEGRAHEALIPRAVRAYIDAHGLYSPTAL